MNPTTVSQTSTQGEPMPVHPKVMAILAEIERLNYPPAWEMTPAQLRQYMESTTRGLGPAEPVARAEDLHVTGKGGHAIPMRLYVPQSDTTPGVIVYYHGGGWVAGSIATHDGLCRALANASGAAVVSVEYRLAPEHPYPAALEDAYQAARWVAESADELAVDSRRLIVAGDSAGGNLAAAVALMARDVAAPAIAGQMLLYPATDRNFDNSSYLRYGRGYLLTSEAMQYYWKLYLQDPLRGEEPYAVPLQAEDLRNLPAAMVITAGYDVLRDEGEAYAVRLREAGNRVHFKNYPDMVHGFLRWTHHVDQARRAVDDLGRWTRELFAALVRQA